MTDFADIKVTQRVNSEDRIVTVNEKVLSKSEIIDLLVEYMEENVGLHQEILDLKVHVEQYQIRIERLEMKIQRERNATQKQYGKWEKEALEKIKNLEKENANLIIEVEALKQIKPLRKLPRELTVLKLKDGDSE